MAKVSELNLNTELTFWSREAYWWKIRLIVTFVISFFLGSAICIAVALVLPSYLAAFNAFTWPFIFPFFVPFLFPASISGLWFNYIRRSHFRAFSDRWIKVYDHLFKIGAFESDTKLKYNPFFHNASVLTNEARYLVQVLKTCTEDNWNHKIRALPSQNLQTLLAMKLIDEHLAFLAKVKSWLRFWVVCAPLLLVVLAICLVLIFAVYKQQPLGVFLIFVFVPFSFLVLWIIRVARINFKHKALQKNLIKAAGVDHYQLNNLLAQKRKHEYYVKVDHIFSKLNSAIYPVASKLLPPMDYFRVGFYATNELKALITYFGLPQSFISQVVEQPKPRFEIKF